MIVYRVNVLIEKSTEADWSKWMREHHISDVVKTGYFDHAAMFRNSEKDTETHAAYVFEYQTDSMSRYLAYCENAAAELQKDHTSRYQGRFLASREILERVAVFNG